MSLPRPYYDRGGITIYHGDARDLVPLLAADLLAFDPPYGSNDQGGYGRRQLGLEVIENDDDTEVRDTVLGVWGERPAVCFASPRKPSPPGAWDYRLVWDKGVPGLGSPWRWQHEEIYLRGTWRNDPGLSSVLTYSTDRAMRRRFHPHEKPIGLMLALLQGTDGVIIDPTMGSGSTLRAALDLGRRAIGIDTVERHCAVAVRRLAQEVLPGLQSVP